MARLEDLTRGASVKGILLGALVTPVDVGWHGSSVVELTYNNAAGHLGNDPLNRNHDPILQIIATGKPRGFDADGGMLRSHSDAYRIRLTHLFDSLPAIHTSRVEPLR